MSSRLEIGDGHTTSVPAHGVFPEQVHIFDLASIRAINAALAARRPLLVRGEPGTGKSQLAHAAAIELKRAFIAKVIDARTESRDLLYTFDAVARLGHAQCLGALSGLDQEQLRATLEIELDPRRYLLPGPLWWAFNYKSAHDLPAYAASDQPSAPRDWVAKHGSVVLIDEIDKADANVPNGLLEALGSGRFKAPGHDQPIEMDPEVPTLVVITTNEERALPDAFLRRCLVLHLSLPDGNRAELIEFLDLRGKAHFGRRLSAAVRKEAAQQLAQEREEVRARGLAPPGQAEYLDLLRAVAELAGGEDEQLEVLKHISGYTYKKHPPEPTR